MLKKAKDLRSQIKVAKVVHDKLIVYEKERGNDTYEAQVDPHILLKLKVKGCGYPSNHLRTSNKLISFILIFLMTEINDI